jgi:predicted Zn-dependent peptidase
MRTSRPSVTALLAGGLLATLVAFPAAASAEDAPAAPGINRWTLPNGMRVVTQDVPHAAGVAVTIGYPYGSERDPAGMPGLASLLAEVAYTSPAGDIPLRTREEMPGIRPLGWNIKVTPRFTLLSEVVKPDHLAGTLYEFSLRMKSLTVTKQSLGTALATVRDDQARRHGGDLAWSLRQAVRDAASGTPVAPASGKSDLDRLQPGDVHDRIAAVLAPGNVVLSIAGPLGDQAVEKLTRDLFGALPAGAPLDSLPRAPLRPDSATITVNGIDRAYGAFGLIAPPLGSSSHPEFFLHAVLLGAVFSTNWGPPQPPLDAWFEYAILDEPDLMRIYPPLPPGAGTPRAVSDAIESV